MPTATRSSILTPQYLQDIPTLDGWKTAYDYYLNTAQPAGAAGHGDPQQGPRQGVAVGTDYTVTSFEPTDYDQDIVWADGFFVRWPQKP